MEFEGVPILSRLQRLLANVLGGATVIAAPGKYASIGLNSIPDRWPGEGPLGGIITALLHSTRAHGDDGWNFIVGCDMPFLTQEWLAYLAEHAQASNAEVFLPRSRSGLEPLCACWKTAAAPKLQAAFDKGVRKITDAIRTFEMEILDEPHWKRFDSAGRLFWNMNTQADYDEARRVLKAGQS